MADKNVDENNASTINQAVAEGGAYELIRKRLVEQGKSLEVNARTLNQARTDEFGSTDMSVVGRVRVRTENNCTARDIVQVGRQLVFGYNVFLGLKKETKIEDVFALYTLEKNGDNFEMTPQSMTDSFLADPQFSKEFGELYAYYKHASLVQIVVKNQKLLAAFQIGEKVSDIRVFRWSISADQTSVTYMDNRGERDIALPPKYDFEWREVTREYSVHGKHPHFNIQDKVFVETVNGDLTIKVEDNTEDGRGIYSETVEDKTQSLDDADIFFAEVGELVLLKIKPYREEKYRYLIFNSTNQQVDRIDAIGESCIQLPENHGLIFPGGYYLQNGEQKRFDDDLKGLRFKRCIKSPNGEDVLYVFYEQKEGIFALFAYNLITKQLQNPIYCHGYTIFDDGESVIFHAEGEDPTRVHPMQVWQTPYVSEEFAAAAPSSQSFFGKIGNAELVRGISDLYSICRAINDQSPSAYLYEDLQKSTRRIYDAYHWIESTETQSINDDLKEIIDTSDLILDEFEKVESIRKNSVEALRETEKEQQKLLDSIHPDRWQTPGEFVEALDGLRHQFGHLMTLKEYRYIDVNKIAILEEQINEAQEKLGKETVLFLSRDTALAPYSEELIELEKVIETAATIVELTPTLEAIEKLAGGLDLLSEMMTTLQVADATVRTAIIDAISDVYAKLNQTRAKAKNREKQLGQGEAVAQFAAQFKLFSQSISNALSLASTPAKCDEHMSRLLVQLEELESQFSGFDDFFNDIVAKREEVYESFENRKQQLLDEQQRRAQSIADAAERIIENINRRIKKFSSVDELNTYFASDSLVLKSRELVQNLHNLDSSVKADDIDARLKAAKDQAVRALRDKADIYEDGGNVIKMGPRHKFSVNTQELDLTIIPRNGKLCFHLTGTDFFETATHPKLTELAKYWEQSLPSENDQVYRAEYLAYSIYQDALAKENDLSIEKLSELLPQKEALVKVIRAYATPKYKEGYEKGIHDHDAAVILQSLLPILESCDLLRFAPDARALATIFWANTQRESEQQTWTVRAQSALQMYKTFASSDALKLLIGDVDKALVEYVQLQDLNVEISTAINLLAAEYLVYELSRERLEFITSKYASDLAKKLKQEMDVAGAWRGFQTALKELKGQAGKRWQLTHAWIKALVDNSNHELLSHYIPEAIAIVNAEERISRRHTEVDLNFTVNGLMGQHSRLKNQQLDIAVDEFLARLKHHQQVLIPEYFNFLDVRQQVIDEQRKSVRLDEFKPKPLSSFVRNKLINESYLPIIGDNLAKQMGTLGDKKRTDLMGLLMMISPPGYGKTTLMEYVASRLGLIFMKINCPSLGHEVDSLDPEQAPNATAKQELEKLNLGLEMGSNVMLYLDDIQHTNPEFLQKFISLCDGTRRIEGIWKGETKTYDMRGRKFCVIMAGNPYTESGEMFKIPDMLANRADIYNLGDVLGGMDDVFALSYLENTLTSNPILAPMATREMSDVYKLVDKARGLEVATTDLSHNYSAAEVNEITSVLQKLFKIRDVILSVNQQYIASAAQDDIYRTEPSFKLQGSYRNMNKMAEKVSAVMNEEELQQVINDHYLGEAQLLTTGAEENLLKLKELRGVLTKEESVRWENIKKEFNKNRIMGGANADSGTKVANQLAELTSHMENISTAIIDSANNLGEKDAKDMTARQLAVINRTLKQGSQYGEQLKLLLGSLDSISKTLAGAKYQVEVVNQPVPGIDLLLKTIADTLETSIFPLVRAMEGKLNIDLRTHKKLEDVFEKLKSIETDVKVTQHKPIK